MIHKFLFLQSYRERPQGVVGDTSSSGDNQQTAEGNSAERKPGIVGGGAEAKPPPPRRAALPLQVSSDRGIPGLVQSGQVGQAVLCEAPREATEDQGGHRGQGEGGQQPVDRSQGKWYL